MSLIQSSNGVYFQPFNFTGALICDDGLAYPSEIRNVNYSVQYTEPYIHNFTKSSTNYVVNDWTDYKKLNELESGLATQVISRYVAFSYDNYQWIWPLLTLALIIIYIATITAGVYF